MYEKPLERLNYFNGQRLEASDLKTEQDYHIRTRRWLNKSLYSAGIGRGLEVRAIPPDPVKQDPPRVGVSLGLAIDDDGREIILLEEALIEVCSYSGTGESTVVGNYLVIEYAEETVAFEKSAGCGVRETGTRTSTSTTNWGGPSRVQAKPKFSWIPFPPQPGSNQIALARVELGLDCTTVHQIDAGIRRYIGAASAAKVRQYALEGEREVACLPGVLPHKSIVYFHIRGRVPNAVTLFLRAEKFSTLFYTENGHHQHLLDIRLAAVDGAHRHDIGAHETSPVDYPPISSELGLLEQPDDSGFAKVALNVLFPVLGAFVSHERTTKGYKIAVTPIYNFKWKFAGNTISEGDYPPIIAGNPSFKVSDGGSHFHKFGSTPGTEVLTKADDNHSKHTHQFESTSAKYSGILSNNHPNAAVDQSYSARGGAPLSFIHNLLIAIDGIDRTDAIKAQIVDSIAADKQKWLDGLGDGTDSHPLANKEVEAVPIRLDFLSDVRFSEGEHMIEFSVGLAPGGKANGGKILYNLYIE